MKIRNLAAVFLLTGIAASAAPAAETGALFPPDVVNAAQGNRGKVALSEPGKAQITSGEKNLILKLAEPSEVKPLAHVSGRMDASGKGKCGFFMAVYDKDGRKIGEEVKSQSVTGKPAPMTWTFRVRKTYGGKIPCRQSISVFVEKNSDVTLSGVKTEVDNAPPNSTLTAKNRTDWAAGTYTVLTKRAQTQKNISVMFLGDSITMLWEFPSDHKYPGGLDSWNKHFKPMGASNYGVSGDTVENVLWRVTEGKQLECNPSLIVLMIGTNNLHRQPFNTPEEIVAGIDHLIQVIQAKLPKTKILLLGVFPRRGSHPIPEINAKLAEAAVARKVSFMDLSETFLRGKKEVSAEIFRDGLHLSPAGYEIWAQALLPEIGRLLPK
ncbi:MAG: GDSL-like Lipase/Acylhydrolase [Lentisphaerae bacterium ADurb.Bin242]|nr:MAG: GDSL-like Lipase/Acylhydrolase [Lentisphaerae bacterium ADurb.Bin242]